MICAWFNYLDWPWLAFRTIIHFLLPSNAFGFHLVQREPVPEGCSPIWPIRGCAAGQGMVFVLSVLNMGRYQNTNPSPSPGCVLAPAHPPQPRKITTLATMSIYQEQWCAKKYMVYIFLWCSYCSHGLLIKQKLKVEWLFSVLTPKSMAFCVVALSWSFISWSPILLSRLWVSLSFKPTFLHT